MWTNRLTTSCLQARRVASAIPGGVNCCIPNTFSNALQRINRQRALSGAISFLQYRTKTTSITINGNTYKKDTWFNVPQNVIDKIPRRLHLQKDHPISITRQIIESVFPAPTFKYYNEFDPVVTTHQNFDSLGFPKNHPGRAKSDTYYINENTLLRTHTSAHQADVFRENLSEGYLISADVYRRDEIDKSHYPIFHQMEGARSWDRAKVTLGNIPAAVWSEVEKLPKHNIDVEYPTPLFDEKTNPRQEEYYSPFEVETISTHLMRSLELMVVEIFTRAKSAALKADPNFVDEPLQMRWVEAYFPFTSPSWELEVYYGGDWLEVLGCGLVKQDLYINAHVPEQRGWAFGIGLERIAMLLFQIPDIRLFWSQDERFLSQFKGVSDNLSSLKRFVPFSKYPICAKDVSFWLGTPSAAGGNTKANVHDFHENDVMEIVRSVAGDDVENVKLVDQFTHPKTGRKSMCYRINYRSLERTLTNKETNDLHDKVTKALVEKLGVEIR
ncbi:phenylalanyl-tRNA synthetase mitochondrial precursor [Daldinia caldariorum]|uniref:phenylalanyl-tRNA synthetase mitochondrial precursor n=1 Tax=Daldinia caldariorum TaxID=326644 RepID=UPI002007EF46|nr:phenylalanyl-tRNA synthetase mitochondrial precursor [Daldinia caldariorum]KAI1471051.1 phenylalanyl-tRNA synthetase mitochondrial precursor [Daldinia caldariorum]